MKKGIMLSSLLAFTAVFILGDVACSGIAGDINNDSRVDILDFAAMANNWLLDCSAQPDHPQCIPKTVVIQFYDDFQSQNINLNKWDFAAYTGEQMSVVESPANSGNWALRGTTTSYACKTAVIAKQTFKRADDLVCEFRWWYDMGGAEFVDYTSINGPWRKTPLAEWDSYVAPIAQDLEAGFGEFIRRHYGTDDHHWAEGNADWEGGLEFDDSFKTAVFNATSRENSLLLRVRLGKIAGAKCYYSIDNGVYWNEVYMADGTPIDTTALTPGAVYSPAGGGGGSVTVSGSPEVYLGFGVRGATWQYWDDIVVKSYAGVEPDIPDPCACTTIPGLPQQAFYWTATYPNGTINRLSVRVLNDTACTEAYVIEPTGTVDPDRRWIWIVPLWLGLNSEYGNTIARYYIEGVLAQGFHVVGIDVGTSCGSSKGAEVFQDFYELLMADYNLQPNGARLIGTSNGGLITYGWAFRYPQYVDKILGIYPAVDFTTWPGLSQVITFPPAGLSYNLTLQELTSRITEFNPIDNLQPLATENIPIYHIHGDADTVVPMTPNSIEAKLRYEALGGQFTLEVFSGFGHGGMEFFQYAPALTFLLQ